VAIENQRNQFFQGQPNYPKDIYNYVNYQTQLEVPLAVGINPEEMGLDKETVKIITDYVMK
jgi:hypothetical protein